MNQYEIENAIHKIEGYHMPKSLEHVDKSFARAKKECLENMKKDMAAVKSITVQQFAARKKT